MSQTLYLDFLDLPVDSKTIEKDPETALKILISQQSKGNVNKDLFHSIVKVVMGKNNNSLKRLLYYYFETLMDDSCFIMCINQINKDLISPNEFVRGFALKLAAKIKNIDFVSLPLIEENLNYKNYYVRLNAVSSITQLAIRFDLDVDHLLVDLMRKETNSKVLKVLFVCMDLLSINFESFLSRDFPEDVSVFLAQQASDVDFMRKMAASCMKYVAFYASCNLLVNKQNIDLHKITEILQEIPELKGDFSRYVEFLPGIAKSSDLVALLDLLDPFDACFSEKVIDVCFECADASDYGRISEILYEKCQELNLNSDIRKNFKILLIKKSGEFANSHCLFVDGLVEECLENLSLSDPEIVYVSLNFLRALEFNNLAEKHKIGEKLIDCFEQLQYGKIFRFCFDVISINITLSAFDVLLDKLFSHFDQNAGYFYLSNKSEVFLGNYICFSVSNMLKKLKANEGKRRAKTIALCIKCIDYGKQTNFMDTSSRATITTIIRSLIAGTESVEVALKTDKSRQEKTAGVFDSLCIPLLNISKTNKKYIWEDSVEANSETIQLSGLGDPLYVECNLIHSKYECILDILIINQTDFFLQNFNINFTHSKHLKPLSFFCPSGLQPSSAITLKATFSILESSNSFITACMSFRFPNQGDYTGKPFIQHLSEIKLDIKEFLHEAENVNFMREWKTLEWENIYSLSLSIQDMERTLNKLVQTVNGKLCNKQSFYNFLAANFACFTVQKAAVLINVCLSENKHAEIRVRSNDEAVVKSVSGLLSECIKTIK
ncbi:hypothetical protein NUSPORA_02354 [Nucleospora cyclopteri]